MTVDVQLSLRWGDQSYLNQALRQGPQGGQGLGGGGGVDGLTGVSVMTGEEATGGLGHGMSPTTGAPPPPIRSFHVTIKHARGLVADQFGSADAYCELFYGDKLVAKTEVGGGEYSADKKSPYQSSSQPTHSTHASPLNPFPLILPPPPPLGGQKHPHTLPSLLCLPPSLPPFSPSFPHVSPFFPPPSPRWPKTPSHPTGTKPSKSSPETCKQLW